MNKKPSEALAIVFGLGFVALVISMPFVANSQASINRMAEKMINCKHEKMSRSRTWFEVDSKGEKLIEEYCRTCRMYNKRSVSN